MPRVLRPASHLTAFALSAALTSALSPAPLIAQAGNPSPTTVATAPRDSSAPGTLRASSPRIQWGAWIAQSVDTRTASHNERIDGSLTMVALRAQRTLPFPLPASLRINYMVELLPLLVVTSEAPFERRPVTPYEGTSPIPDAYARHRSLGAGISPFGAEVVWAMNRSLSAVAGATAGGELFTHVVPYGEATRANFTFTPGVALQWQAPGKSELMVGYKLHHLSNASFGRANPGLNAHLLSVSFIRAR